VQLPAYVWCAARGEGGGCSHVPVLSRAGTKSYIKYCIIR
jgi:hypothetical protein